MDAIACAQEIRALTRGLGLSLRCGLHVGELALHDGDIGGIAIHIAARIVEHASSDEILVSSTTTELVAGSRFSFRDRGEHQLRGLASAWRLFAVQ